MALCATAYSGNSGLRVSEACFGTMTFGEDWCWVSGKDEARQIYESFRELGGRRETASISRRPVCTSGDRLVD